MDSEVHIQIIGIFGVTRGSWLTCTTTHERRKCALLQHGANQFWKALNSMSAIYQQDRNTCLLIMIISPQVSNGFYSVAHRRQYEKKRSLLTSRHYAFVNIYVCHFISKPQWRPNNPRGHDDQKEDGGAMIMIVKDNGSHLIHDQYWAMKIRLITFNWRKGKRFTCS